MARHWSKRLARRIQVKDGPALVTLRDAGNFISNRFGSVTHSAVLRFACEVLMKAAESGKREDIEAATDQVERLLQARGLM